MKIRRSHTIWTQCHNSCDDIAVATFTRLVVLEIRPRSSERHENASILKIDRIFERSDSNGTKGAQIGYLSKNNVMHSSKKLGAPS